MNANRIFRDYVESLRQEVTETFCQNAKGVKNIEENLTWAIKCWSDLEVLLPPAQYLTILECLARYHDLDWHEKYATCRLIHITASTIKNVID